MRTFKRTISIITALAILVVTFSFLGLMPVSAEVTAPEGYEIDEQIKIDFNTDGKGWSGTNGNATTLAQITDGDNKYINLSTPNGNGYNIELANGSNSTTAYTMVGNTKYSIEFKIKVVSSSNADCVISLNFGTKAAYDPSLSKPYIKSFKTQTLSTTEWTTLSYDFTTTNTMAANTYDSKTSMTNICDRMYLVANGGGAAASYYIDDVVITKYKVATPKNQITYINFDTDGKGWSDTNGPSYLTQVTDPDDSTNKYMTLHTPDGKGYNMELGAGSNSDTAYILEGNTKYSISFKFKPVDSTAGKLGLYLGSKSASTSGYSKYGIKTYAGTSYALGEWHTVTYEFTTTETMSYNSYNGSGNTNICDRLYFVAQGSANTWAIDDVEIKKYVEGATGDEYVDGIKPEVSIPDVTDKITFNTSGKGYSDYLYKYNQDGIFDHIVESDNGYVKLGTPNTSGYNIELAKGDTTTPYTLEPSSNYTVTIKFKVVSRQTNATLCLNVGSQSKYNANLDKPYLNSWNTASYNDGQWHEVTHKFTTGTTLAANEFDTSSSKTNVCNRLYVVTTGAACELYIDEVTITKHGTGDGSGDDNTGDQPEEEKQVYTIPDFNHEPYKTYAAPGKHNGVWYCSVRWSTYNDNGNSVMRFKYAYDISENAPSTSGSRGTTAMGTNGSQHAMMCLVDDDNPSVPIKVTQGKSYRITFKYKVTNVELNSFVSFNIMRGQYSSGWTGSSGIGSATNKDDDRYIIAIEYAPTNGWVEASYTFTADYSTNPERDVIQIGGAGYGDALIDDIKIEEIDASEVEPVNNDNSKYDYSINGQQSSINSYKGKDADLTITNVIGRRQLTAINEYAFLYNRYTKNIVIENGPTTIGNYAFEYAKVLETISIPASITTIGKGAFYGIKNMKSFTVDAANESFASVDGVLYTKDMKTLLYYPAAKDATTFTVPTSVTTIAEGAFLNATKLQTVVLPDGLTTIERRAFMNCTALENADLPSTVATIGSSAFRGCDKLNRSQLDETVAVGENAFADCDTVYTVGNVNSADGVDALDNAVLTRHIAGWDGYDLGYFEKLSADVNGDGTVDALDNAILTRHIAGWDGYKTIPYTGLEDHTYEDYASDSDTPELVVNLSEQNSRKVTPKRDINYDPNKEDVIIILITGQSNSGTNGYRQEYEYKYTTNHGGATHPNWEITAEPTRPDEGTVFFGATVTKLNSSNDVYYKTDAASLGASTMGGYSPAMGKALHDATGAKIVFVQASKGAVGMHEWTPEPEKYDCACSENGGGKLYSTAIANFTKTYQALEDDYNIIATAYVYNQGEHEEHAPYATASTCTVHDDQTYYDALLSMHYGFLSECEIDCGGMYMPRSYYARYTNAPDIEQNSRRPSYARTAMYRAAQEVDNFFIFSNVTEKIYKNGELKPDPTNSIHYSMGAYNAIGAQNGDSMAKYFGFTDASEFTGIKVFNKVGVELCAFDANGKLISGSDVVDFSDDNSKLYIRIDPTGTMYTLNYSSAGTTTDFVDDFGIITSVEGQTSFKIVINPPVK